MNSVSRLTLRAAVAAIALGSLASSSRADGVGTVFVIALENHNFTQPSTYTAIQQLADRIGKSKAEERATWQPLFDM